MNTSRRSVFGLLGAAGAAPLAAGALPGAAHAAAKAGSGSGAAGTVPPELRPGGAFDRRLAGLAAEDAFSGGVLLAHRGRTVLARSHGMANRALALPNGPGTRFCLGSVTKLFTAVAVAGLAERGAVAFQGRLGEYLDGFPPEVADKVTVHHLLTHGAGMGDFRQDPRFAERKDSWRTHDEVLAGVLDLIRDTPLRFPPGTGYAYSNSGFAVLGAIVARVAGRSYFDHVREHVFAAAGMTGSDFLTQAQWRDDPAAARPYATTASGERVDALDRHEVVGSPAGGSFATCADLERFARALTGGRLVGPPYAQLLLSPKQPMPMRQEPGRPAAFEVYGAIAEPAGDQWVVSRNGGAPGVSTELRLFAPARDWVVVVLANHDRAAREPAALATRIITGQGAG
jgi:CubicO group peptidase (beta-lactamase class C family)